MISITPRILTLDFGNTLLKAGVFIDNRLVYYNESDRPGLEHILRIVRTQKVQAVVASSVTDRGITLLNSLKRKLPVLQLTAKTKLPVKNKYSRKFPPGTDRLASAVGANSLFPRQNVLAINAGTCIIYDFVNEEGCFLGGSISAGIDMRFKALNQFTDKLPMVKKSPPRNLSGVNTNQCIINGTILGTACEVDGIISRYKKKYPKLKVVLSGGDADWLAPHLKNKIFATPHLILKGLFQIYKFNAS